MAIKPILFNTEMVRAILDGRKSCTRRLIRKHIENKYLEYDEWVCAVAPPGSTYLREKEFYEQYPPYQPGDILYVRETWHKGLERYIYRADYSDTEKFYRGGKEIEMKWHPSIHMPKEAARIWLRVTDVRIERLQEINAGSALSEGADKYIRTNGELNESMTITSFIGIWNSTIKKSDLDRYGWDANPWVWVIEFERCEKPEE
nr:MAG TPA: ASCH domain protein [Caudoviricetes sp.]